jgi:hypothetical protein
MRRPAELLALYVDAAAAGAWAELTSQKKAYQRAYEATKL